MNFDLSETQELFRSTTERFARTVDVAARDKIRLQPDGYDRGRWTDLAKLGLLSIAATEEQGGLGGTLDDLSIIAESFGKENALDPWLENGALPIRLLSLANKTDHLDSLLDGTQIAALAFAEPSARYDIIPSDTLASRRDDNSTYLLNGEKHFVMGGSLADLLLITAQCDDEFSLFCLPSDSPGINSKVYRLADGSEGTTIVLNNVEAPDDARLAITFEQFQQVVGEVCMLCCAEMLGLSQRLLNDTLAYVKERKQFGAPIGSFQVIQHGLVDCYTELEQMRSLLYRTLLLENESVDSWRAHVMGAKSFIADSAVVIARTAVQYHGAMGVTDEVAIGHALKRIILLSRLFGDATHNLKQYMEIA